MIRVTSSARAGEAALEQEVDECLNEFNEWYKNVQGHTDPDTGARIPTGMVGAERAVLKTFLGWRLGVGGHYTPPEEEKDAEESSD
jgi:hypothetical protein